jgi:uncharacterized iron-regulated membrane protein
MKYIDFLTRNPSLMVVPFKRVLFRLHWIIGIGAGLVLGVVGFTGGLLGFEQPILATLNPQLRIAAAERATLGPDQWLANARAAYPDYAPRSIAWTGDDAAITLRMARDGARGGIDVAVDPYNAKALGMRRGTGFFKGVEKLHRSLAAGPVGKQIVGASTALLIALVISGVYLRWPRRPRSMSAWLRPDLKLKGRGFWWNLHAVAGTWLLAFYLVAAFTGLWWSYDFYRDAVNRAAGVTTPLRRGAAPIVDAGAALLPVDRAWVAFRTQVPSATRATLALSDDTAAPLVIRYQTATSPHERAWNTLKVDAASGEIVGRERYADLPRGRRFVFALFPLHSGGFFGGAGRVAMALASLLMPFFAITGLWLWWLRRRNAAARRVPAGGALSIGARALARSLRDSTIGSS